MTLRRMFIAGLLASCLPVAAAAQDRLAYVIGNARFGGEALSQPTKDAVAMSRALLGLGFDVVRRQNTNAVEFLIGSRAAQTVALYYSGRTEVTEDGDILLRGAQLGDAATQGWPLFETAQAFRDAGAEEVLVFVETCQVAEDTLASLTDDVNMDGIFVALSHDPEVGCVVEAEVEEDGDENEARFSDRVQLALATPDVPLATAFEDAAGPGWMISTLSAPIYMWPQEAESRSALPEDALAMLEKLPEAEQARMREVWQSAGLIDATGQIISRSAAQNAPTTTILVAPEASSSGVTIIAPVATPVSPVIPKTAPGGVRVAGRIKPVEPATVNRGNAGNNGVQIFNPVVRGVAEAAVATAAGLPDPYIIVGEIRVVNASFDPLETVDVTGTSVDTSNFEIRNQMRGDNPSQYEGFVNSGVFDPDDNSERGLARAIQTELARMQCYTAGIDGVWGNGSRGSVDRYFVQINEPASGREPTIDLYRKIILKDDVTCPVVRQAVAPQRSTGTTTRRATTNNAPRAAAPRAAAPAARRPAASSGGINTNNLGSGVFR
ncbi:MAG: caspase family protein [Aliishimia sp.]